MKMLEKRLQYMFGKEKGKFLLVAIPLALALFLVDNVSPTKERKLVLQFLRGILCR